MADNGRVIYTAHAHVTGGRTAGHGRTSDGALEVDLRPPVEIGGEGGGTNPEQLFAVGYAACFESALGSAARRRRLEVGDVAIDSSVMLMPTESRGYALAVALAVTLPSIDDAVEAIELVKAADQICPYSNATRGNIDVVLTANGPRGRADRLARRLRHLPGDGAGHEPDLSGREGRRSAAWAWARMIELFPVPAAVRRSAVLPDRAGL